MKLQHGVLAFVVLFLGSVIFMGVLINRGPSKPRKAEAYAEQSKRLEALFEAPDFEYGDQRGAHVTKQSLLGRPWVANFIFTTCKSVCPLLTAKMVQLQRKMPDAPIAFVSFSVDPEHDTPMLLAAYAQQWAPEEKRWSLLATDATLNQTLAAFRVTAEANDSGQGLDPILHSSVFVLVDAKGTVRGVYDSEHREEFQALVRDARTLAGTTTAPPRQQRTGEALYTQLSCAACHENPSLAPPLGGLIGRQRGFDNGLMVTADEGYLIESIVAPDMKRVAGYPLKMPTYDGVLEGDELATLLTYLKTLPEKPELPPAQTAVDPVCGMQVLVGADTPVADGPDGGRFYFCSASCRDQFVKR